jgi:ABC-type sugar transport system permease subunit
LLLAINIFPLLWTIQLSFTNYRANRPLDLYGYSFVTILAGTLGFVVVSHFPE